VRSFWETSGLRKRASKISLPLFEIGTDILKMIRLNEIIWRGYVAYSVLYESYASVRDQESYGGNRFRIYSKLHLLQHMSRVTFSCDEDPGPTRHYCVVCEDHVLSVLSVDAPRYEKCTA
jgi:hypothetical protein